MQTVTEKPEIRVKRAYDVPAKSDGCRILVDRVWPRGLSREKLELDSWMKEVAPTSALRQWFDHDGQKWLEFRRRYFRELDDRPEVVDALLDKVRAGTVTLVFGARDTACNNAVALMEYVHRQFGR